MKKQINRLQLMHLIVKSIIVLCVISLVSIMSFITGRVTLEKQPLTIIMRDTVYITKSENNLKNLNIKQFKNIIAEIESGNDYTASSQNYFGKYQISETNIALSDYDPDAFMKDKEIQEWVMDDLFYEYLYHTVSYCNKYNGTKVFDLEIDTWTILYGCHCIGYPKIKKWLDKPIKNRLYYQMINFNKKR